jgi:Thioredoxin domain-containing protein
MTPIRVVSATGGLACHTSSSTPRSSRIQSVLVTCLICFLPLSFSFSTTTTRIARTTTTITSPNIPIIKCNSRLYISKQQYDDNDNSIGDGNSQDGRMSVTRNYSQDDDDDDEAHKVVTLTAQERILQESLGIPPETPLEKEIRINQRKAELSKEQTSKLNNILVAIAAFSLAILNYTWQYTHPITSLTLLTEMQRNSEELNVIGNNGKPTVVDFWAPWCENCKASAPTLASIEQEYKDKVNFIMVDGDKGENWPIIERFGVDAIPHLAMVGSDGVVETALIGPIPRRVLREDLDAMLENVERRSRGQDKVELPYVMYDAFRSRPDLRQLNFPVDGVPPIRLGGGGGGYDGK